MCLGSGQKNALASDQAFGKEISQNYGTDFSEAQGIFNSLNGNMEAIVAKGPGQQGDTPEELAAKNSQVVENAAASNKNINASIRQKAAMSGAAPGVESGATEGAVAGSEAKVENNLSNQEAGITQENYATGRQNYDTAVSGEMKLPAATMDPVNQAAGEVNSANQTTGKQADANAESSNSWMGLVGGLVGSAAKAIKPICYIAAATYDGWDDPRVDVVRNYIFNIWANESLIGAVVAKLYRAFGESIGKLVKKSTTLRSIFKFLFDKILNKSKI